MLRKTLLISFVVALCATTLPSLGATWDIYADFGLTNPSGAWTYGYADYDIMDGPGYAMTPFDYVTGDLATGVGWTRNYGGPDYTPYVWYNPGAQGIYPANSVVFSSGDSGGAYENGYNGDPYTVIRWTAPADGQYAVDGVFKQMIIGSNWTGRMDLHVLVNGVSQFDCIVNGLPGDITEGPGPFTYTGTFDLVAGDTVDFAGGPYTYNVSDFVDVTGSGVREVPEPGTLALLGCALVGLIAYAWRRR